MTNSCNTPNRVNSANNVLVIWLGNTFAGIYYASKLHICYTYYFVYICARHIYCSLNIHVVPYIRQQFFAVQWDHVTRID